MQFVRPARHYWFAIKANTTTRSVYTLTFITMFTELLLFVCLVCLCKFWMSNKYSSKYPPGPIGLPLLGYLPFLGTDLPVGLSKLAKKHGSIFSVQLGSNRCVVLNDLQTIKQAFKLDECNGRPNSYFFNERCEGKNGIIANEGSSLTEQRKFTLHQLKNFGFGKKMFEGVIHEEVEELISRFRKENGKKVDLDVWFNLAAVNILWHTVAGERFSHDDPRLTEIVKNLVQFTGNKLALLAVTILPMLQAFPKFSGFTTFLEAFDNIKILIKDLITNHKGTYDESYMRDFTDVYLKKIKDTSDSNSPFYKESGVTHLRFVLEDLFGAGSETTSTTLTWSILFLILHPEIQRKCQKEIDTVVGRDKLPSLEDRSRMPYVQATITEIFRISSVIPLGLFHNVTQETEISGFIIPKDTVLISNLMQVHYDPKIWVDPEKFRPERFLSDDGQFVNHEALIPFGFGKRVCLGEPLARNETFLILTGILQSINFSVPEDESPPSLEANSGIVRHPKMYWVTVNVRD